MVIKTKYEFGDVVYLKTDPEQIEFEIVGIIARPGQTMFEITHLGEIMEVYDFQISKTINELKMLGVDKKEE